MLAEGKKTIPKTIPRVLKNGTFVSDRIEESPREHLDARR